MKVPIFMEKFSSKENWKPIQFKKLLAEPEKYEDAIYAIKKDIAYAYLA